MGKIAAPRLLFVVSFIFVIMFSLNSGIRMGEAKLCERYSTTWSGICGDSDHCDNQCKTWEHAVHGACHADFLGSACFCYVNC